MKMEHKLKIINLSSILYRYIDTEQIIHFTHYFWKTLYINTASYGLVLCTDGYKNTQYSMDVYGISFGLDEQKITYHAVFWREPHWFKIKIFVIVLTVNNYYVNDLFLLLPSGKTTTVLICSFYSFPNRNTDSLTKKL